MLNMLITLVLEYKKLSVFPPAAWIKEVMPAALGLQVFLLVGASLDFASSASYIPNYVEDPCWEKWEKRKKCQVKNIIELVIELLQLLSA